MRQKFNYIAGFLIVAAFVGIGAFLYATRDLAAPTTAIQDAAVELETSNETATEVVYRISQDDSQVTFTLDEVLNGSPKTVVGTTDQVAGDVVINLTDPAQSEIGEIRINARTFETDDSRRDNMIGRFILQSENDQHEFIVFQPASISGLPDSVAVGDTVTLQVTGDLTIAGTTNTVVFDLTATLDSDSTLIGHAETTINRGDFGLTIPSVPSVADVSEAVILQFDFTALAVTDAA